MFRKMSVKPLPPKAKSRDIADYVISHVKNIKQPREFLCTDCGTYPDPPVTGKCGHTRCLNCIMKYGDCICGSPPPSNPRANVLIKSLIEKLKITIKGPFSPNLEALNNEFSVASTSAGTASSQIVTPVNYVSDITLPPPGLPEARYIYGRQLVAERRYLDAAMYLAYTAATDVPISKMAAILLIQVIDEMTKNTDPDLVAGQLYCTLVCQRPVANLGATDLECSICYEPLESPVTTPCGHTFCRVCLYRVQQDWNRCAMCSQSLQGFDLARTEDTFFINTALNVAEPPLLMRPFLEYLPLFTWCVGFPTIACPLMTTDPDYWPYIKTLLLSGRRQFVMVGLKSDHASSNIGMIMEIRDCVLFENDQTLLTAIGISRVKIIHKTYRESWHMVRCIRITDVGPSNTFVIDKLQLLSQEVYANAISWINSLELNVLNEIESTFGQIPDFPEDNEWWTTSDGPEWLWWIIAAIPVNTETQVLLLSTTDTFQRFITVLRALFYIYEEQQEIANMDTDDYDEML